MQGSQRDFVFVQIDHLAGDGKDDPLTDVGDAIRRALKATGGHRANAAKTLGISRKNLWE